MDLQVDEREAHIHKANVQELASWQANGSIDCIEVTLMTSVHATMHTASLPLPFKEAQLHNNENFKSQRGLLLKTRRSEPEPYEPDL